MLTCNQWHGDTIKFKWKGITTVDIKRQFFQYNHPSFPHEEREHYWQEQEEQTQNIAIQECFSNPYEHPTEGISVVLRMNSLSQNSSKHGEKEIGKGQRNKEEKRPQIRRKNIKTQITHPNPKPNHIIWQQLLKRVTRELMISAPSIDSLMTSSRSKTGF